MRREAERSRGADEQFVAGIFATIAALEEAAQEDAVDDRVRSDRSPKRP